MIEKTIFWIKRDRNEKGRTNISEEQHVLVSTSLNEFPNSRVYPNPTKGTIIVEFGGKYCDVSIRVLSIQGLPISIKNFDSVDIFSCDIAGQKGLYLIELREATGKRATFKRMKE